jgi:hypothetical protein
MADYVAQRLHCWSAEDESDGDLLVTNVEPLLAEWQAFFDGARSDGLAAMRVGEELAAEVRIAA